MKKELVVVGIESAPSWGPYVTLSLLDNDSLMSVASSHAGDPAFASMQRTRHDYTTIKMSLPEYRRSGFSVGDRVLLELSNLETDLQSEPTTVSGTHRDKTSGGSTP
ncbi:MAG TPA: hypothetical protein VGR56_01195 [Nitrososphaerales archaeon]|nr:hypothetical protein [Nitrososphaerales archaeon]